MRPTSECSEPPPSPYPPFTLLTSGNIRHGSFQPTCALGLRFKSEEHLTEIDDDIFFRDCCQRPPVVTRTRMNSCIPDIPMTPSSRPHSHQECHRPAPFLLESGELSSREKPHSSRDLCDDRDFGGGKQSFATVCSNVREGGKEARSLPLGWNMLFPPKSY